MESINDKIKSEESSRLTFEERGRNFIVLRILPTELRQIGSFQNSVNLAFFTLMLGLAAGFGSNLLISHETMSDRKLWLFSLFTFVSVILTVYFGIRAIFDRRTCDQRIDNIINQHDPDA